MHPKHYANPFYIFSLVMPNGISIGFATVTLPYLLVQKGFSVEQASAIVAIGVSSNLWRFLWGPVADLTLSLNKWYWIGVIACMLTLLVLCSMPYTLKGITLLTAVLFISQVGNTFVTLPVGGIMAHRIEEHKKGRAGGWYQVGNMGGVGLGGGVGLWVATHYSVLMAGIVLCVLMLLFSLVILLIEDVRKKEHTSIGNELKIIGNDIIGMLKIPVTLFLIIMLLLPIGTGAATNLWSAIANDWKVNADTVALVTGILSAVISAAGCIVGGWMADRWPVWWTYITCGAICALFTILMAAFPYLPYVYISGVLAYGFSLGLLNAAFSAVILFAIGKKGASTKYSLLSSWGNIPVVYMTAIDGWAHDHGGSKFMLETEAIVGIIFIILVGIIIKWMQSKKLLVKPVEEDDTVPVFDFDAG